MLRSMKRAKRRRSGGMYGCTYISGPFLTELKQLGCIVNSIDEPTGLQCWRLAPYL